MGTCHCGRSTVEVITDSVGQRVAVPAHAEDATYAGACYPDVETFMQRVRGDLVSPEAVTRMAAIAHG